MRVGIGFDVHAFTEGRPLILGGIAIDHPFGLAGHSDADVLAHALIDAILSAMRVGDIGQHFPDSEAAYAGADSMNMLRETAELMNKEGWRLIDADTVLVLESPKISSHREAMRNRLAGTLGVSPEAIGVKATTTEGLGFTGRREGAAAHAVVLLERVLS